MEVFFCSFHWTFFLKTSKCWARAFFSLYERYCYGCGVAVDLVLNLFAVEYITFESLRFPSTYFIINVLINFIICTINAPPMIAWLVSRLLVRPCGSPFFRSFSSEWMCVFQSKSHERSNWRRLTFGDIKKKRKKNAWVIEISFK